MLGRKDLNLQPAASKAVAPPLSYAPLSGWRESNPRVSGWKPDAFPLGDTRLWTG